MRIDPHFISGPAGRLEALLEAEPGVTPGLVAVVCHPHPQRGGTLHNKVVFRAAKAAHVVGVPTLRFNFRGVGRSEGSFNDGVGEREDVRAALGFAEERFPGTRVCLAGFSFGAWVGLAVGAADPRVSVLIGLGLPTSDLDFGFVRDIGKPKLIVQGSQDAFGPRDQVQALFDSMPEPKCLHWVEGADHFFTGSLDEVQAVLSSFFLEVLRTGTFGGSVP